PGRHGQAWIGTGGCVRRVGAARRRVWAAGKSRAHVTAGAGANTRAMDNCIFCKIARGEIPSNKVYEDEEILGFHDIKPQAPVHFMQMPKKHIASLADAAMEDVDVLGRILGLSGRLA